MMNSACSLNKIGKQTRETDSTHLLKYDAKDIHKPGKRVFTHLSLFMIQDRGYNPESIKKQKHKINMSIFMLLQFFFYEEKKKKKRFVLVSCKTKITLWPISGIRHCCEMWLLKNMIKLKHDSALTALTIYLLFMFGLKSIIKILWYSLWNNIYFNFCERIKLHQRMSQITWDKIFTWYKLQYFLCFQYNNDYLLSFVFSVTRKWSEHS